MKRLHNTRYGVVFNSLLGRWRKPVNINCCIHILKNIKNRILNKEAYISIYSGTKEKTCLCL